MLLWSTSKYYCSITIRAYLVNLSVCPRTLDVKLKELYLFSLFNCILSDFMQLRQRLQIFTQVSDGFQKFDANMLLNWTTGADRLVGFHLKLMKCAIVIQEPCILHISHNFNYVGWASILFVGLAYSIVYWIIFHLLCSKES